MGCETTSCCCGCSVKTGTVLLLLFDVIFWSLVFTISVNKTQYSDNSMYLLCAALMVITCCIGLYGVHKKKPMLIIPYFIYRILYLNFTFIISVLLTCAGILGLEVLSSMTNVTVWDTKISYSNEFTNFFKGFSIFLVILGILLFWMELHFVRVVFTHISDSRKAVAWQGVILESPSLRTSVNTNHSNVIQRPTYEIS